MDQEHTELQKREETPSLITGRMAKFIEIFPECKFNVSKCCRELGIRRSCYYNWLRDYPHFKVAVDEMISMRDDALEEVVFDKALSQKDTIMQIFLSKARLGYSENGPKSGNGNEDSELSREQRDATVEAWRISNLSMAEYSQELKLKREIKDLKEQLLHSERAE